MKAIVFEKYGSPDVLELKEVEKPTPLENELVIKVAAASANPLDWHRMRGAPIIARLSQGFTKPKNSYIGADVAGWVELVGENVTRFQPGDEVFGEISAGAFAEYACAAQDKFVLKPVNLSFAEAAAVPVAALTALQGLRDAGQIKQGQKVLINGASGGVGTYAVQIAKSFGAEVTGVCSTRNLAMVKAIGAQHVIDYTQEDFTKNGRHYDLIFDAVGNLSVSAMERSLSPQGTAAVAGFTTMGRLFQVIFLGMWKSKTGNKKIGLMKTAEANQNDLLIIQELLESSQVKSVIDRCYPLDETAEAIRYLEKGHAQGKVIITIAPNNNP